MSFVSAVVDLSRHAEVRAQVEGAVARGLPPGLRETFLLVDGETLAIATVWESRDALAAMQSSGEEPLARRVLREAGGDPVATFYDVLLDAHS